MQIPTEADWRDHLLDLDVRSAYANFGGKDLKAAYKMFAENSMECVEDLLFMPVVSFVTIPTRSFPTFCQRKARVITMEPIGSAVSLFCA